MIKVKNEVTVVEVGGEEQAFSTAPILYVDSHWNSSGLVVLTMSGITFAVKSADLIAAVNNAANTARFG